MKDRMKDKQPKTFNATLFRRIRNQILAAPLSYDQEVLVRPSAESPCGTAGCIAGWAVILSHQVTPKELYTSQRTPYRDNLLTAQQALGISLTERAVLFTGLPEYCWPRPFRTRVAADFINLILKLERVPRSTENFS